MLLKRLLRKNRLQSLKLITGLGNPGNKYAETRHNIGFMVASQLAERAGIALKRKGHQGFYGAGRVAGEQTTILLPQTYMNRSGDSVVSACRSLGVPPGDLIVVHDEIDLPFGCLKVKVGGGHGGHNGLRSIVSTSGGDKSFVRLRMGVGRPPEGGDVSKHVLSRFNVAERKSLNAFIDTAAEALEMLVVSGPESTMNSYNNREI
ncbi:MAG: aminoacyl-tRNA hydrolase [Desulfuromonadales bacterium]|nr:aminoacyl-tRNA hydrolase [Desulfuromonadales bacterium]